MVLILVVYFFFFHDRAIFLLFLPVQVGRGLLFNRKKRFVSVKCRICLHFVDWRLYSFSGKFWKFLEISGKSQGIFSTALVDTMFLCTHGKISVLYFHYLGFYSSITQLFSRCIQKMVVVIFDKNLWIRISQITKVVVFHRLNIDYIFMLRFIESCLSVNLMLNEFTFLICN